jgi:hypothetical protein
MAAKLVLYLAGHGKAVGTDRELLATSVVATIKNVGIFDGTLIFHTSLAY